MSRSGAFERGKCGEVMVLGKICNADNVGNVFLPTATHFKPDYTEDENLTSFKAQNMNLRC